MDSDAVDYLASAMIRMAIAIAMAALGAGYLFGRMGW